jgi:hypothetical protein
MASTINDWSTMGEFFEGRRLAQQEKRASNRAWSTQLLAESGVFFTSHNAGAHLIVAERWDFWPGTGRFNERKGRPGHPKREGRGVQRLLKIIKEDGDGATV